MASSLSPQERAQYEPLVSRLLKERCPSERTHSEYLERVSRYLSMHSRRMHLLRHQGMVMTSKLGMRSSTLTGRKYLVAWIDDDATYKAALPSLDAAVSPIAVPELDGVIPLVIAPGWRRRNHSQEFTAIFEHEIVHVNQQLLGIQFPTYLGKGLTSLLENFFLDVQLEIEAHFIQNFHWPPKLQVGAAQLRLDEWVLLRAYTSAVEEIFKRAALGGVNLKVLSRFLSKVPKLAPKRLGAVGCGVKLIQWFLRRWHIDVHIAKEVVMERASIPPVTLSPLLPSGSRLKVPRQGGTTLLEFRRREPLARRGVSATPERHDLLVRADSNRAG